MDNRFMRRIFSIITLIAVILSSLTACGQVKQSETGISASDDTDMWTPSAPVTAMVLTKEESSLRHDSWRSFNAGSVDGAGYI